MAFLRWLALASLFVVFLIPTSVVRAQGYGGGEAVDCLSRNFNYTRCEVPWRDARLVRQLSDTACIRGQNWGIRHGALWVDRGCGGRFVAAGGHHGGGGRLWWWLATRSRLGYALHSRLCQRGLSLPVLPSRPRRRRTRLRQPQDLRCRMHRGTHLGLEP